MAIVGDHSDDEQRKRLTAAGQVLARLAWMQGLGSCNNSRSLFCYERGQGGQGIHGDVTETGPLSQFHSYEFSGNHTRTGSVNVAYQLMDVDETDGGFVYLPGGHKASLPLPAQISSRGSAAAKGSHGHCSGTHALFHLCSRCKHTSSSPCLMTVLPCRAVLGDNHDPDGRFGVVRPLLQAGDVLVRRVRLLHRWHCGSHFSQP